MIGAVKVPTAARQEESVLAAAAALASPEARRASTASPARDDGRDERAARAGAGADVRFVTTEGFEGDICCNCDRQDRAHLYRLSGSSIPSRSFRWSAATG